MYANHGSMKKPAHEIEGVNGRMDGLQAAVLSAKLPYVEAWSNKRREKAQLYNELLKDAEGITVPITHQGATHVFHLYVVRVKKRDKLQTYLKECGVSTGVHYPTALSLLKAYEHLGYKEEDFPVAAAYQNEILFLHIFPERTEDEIEYVAENIKGFFSKG